MVLASPLQRRVAGQLNAALARCPFVPFLICVESGATFEVRRPELVSVCGTQVVLACGNPADGTARVLIDTSNITAIAPADAAETVIELP